MRKLFTFVLLMAMVAPAPALAAGRPLGARISISCLPTSTETAVLTVTSDGDANAKLSAFTADIPAGCPDFYLRFANAAETLIFVIEAGTDISVDRKTLREIGVFHFRFTQVGTGGLPAPGPVDFIVNNSGITPAP